MTCGLEDRCSIQLSYGGKQGGTVLRRTILHENGFAATAAGLMLRSVAREPSFCGIRAHSFLKLV